MAIPTPGTLVILKDGLKVGRLYNKCKFEECMKFNSPLKVVDMEEQRITEGAAKGQLIGWIYKLENGMYYSSKMIKRKNNSIKERSSKTYGLVYSALYDCSKCPPSNMDEVVANLAKKITEVWCE